MLTKRAAVRAAAGGLYDLSALLAFEIVQIEQDGRGKRPTVYLAKMQGDLLPTPMKCILKAVREIIIINVFLIVFASLVVLNSQHPAVSEGDISFERELAANAQLSELPRCESDAGAVAALSALWYDDSRHWPLCFGFLDLHHCRVTGLDPSQTGKLRHALLFEYLADLVPLEPSLLNQQLVYEFLAAVKDLHARNILHRDLLNGRVWPEIAFRNMFIWKSGAGPKGNYALQVTADANAVQRLF